jgi:hypothetical protein
VSVVSQAEPKNVYLHLFRPAETITIPREFESYTPRTFGPRFKETPLKWTPTDDGLELKIPETARTPIDTVIVLSPLVARP